MKTWIAMVTLSLAAWAQSTLANEAPILMVEKHSGFVAPQAAFDLKCRIYPSSVTVERKSGENLQTVASKSKPTLFTDALKDIATVTSSIKSHTGKPIPIPGGPTTDMGTASYLGLVDDGDGKTDKVTIYVRQGLTQLEMADEATRRALTVFADINCAL